MAALSEPSLSPVALVAPGPFFSSRQGSDQDRNSKVPRAKQLGQGRHLPTGKRHIEGFSPTRFDLHQSQPVVGAPGTAMGRDPGRAGAVTGDQIVQWVLNGICNESLTAGAFSSTASWRVGWPEENHAAPAVRLSGLLSARENISGRIVLRVRGAAPYKLCILFSARPSRGSLQPW